MPKPTEFLKTFKFRCNALNPTIEKYQPGRINIISNTLGLLLEAWLALTIWLKYVSMVINAG